MKKVITTHTLNIDVRLLGLLCNVACVDIRICIWYCILGSVLHFSLKIYVILVLVIVKY